MDKKRFHELDALRGIAALAVVLFHFTGYVTHHHHFGDFPFYFRLGERGVSLFFMVSGFVIYYTLERSKTLADFAFSRFSRLYPTYWMSLGLWAAVTVAVLHRQFWITGFAVNATMLQKFIGVGDLDIVYWTLAVELVFYMWMAALFAMGQLKHIVPFCAVWLAASAAWAIVRNNYDISELINTYFILQHVPYFIAGIMFRRIHTQGWKIQHVAVISGAVACNGLIKGMPELIVSVALFSVFALAICGNLRLLAHPVLLWLGAISYPLYVTHRNIGYTLLQIFHDAGVPSYVSVPAVMSAALGLASFVTFYFERPAMQRMRNWYQNKKPRAAGPVPEPQ